MDNIWDFFFLKPTSLDGRTHAGVGTTRRVHTRESDIASRALNQQDLPRGVVQEDLDSQRHVTVGGRENPGRRSIGGRLDFSRDRLYRGPGIQGPQVQQVRIINEEEEARRISLEALKVKAERDYKHMEVSVEKWQVSEEEQTVRDTLHYVLKFFHGRVSTVTPLIVASKAVREMDKSVGHLRKKQAGDDLIASYEEPLNSLSYDICQGAMNKAVDPRADWKRFFLTQVFTNKKEAPVTHAKHNDLIAEARIWEQKQRDNPIAIPNNIVLRDERKELLQRKAVWNVYSRVAVNMAVTTGIVYSALYVGSRGSRR